MAKPAFTQHIQDRIQTLGLANAPLATARSSGRNELEHELGWRAIETFETGLEKTVRWHLDNRPWWQAILDRGYKAKRIGCGGLERRI